MTFIFTFVIRFRFWRGISWKVPRFRPFETNQAWVCLTEGMGYCFGKLVDYVGTMSCDLMWGVLWTLRWLIRPYTWLGVGAVFGHA